jgi:uncharacterized YccA/Bax inhibitor family protein
MRTGNPALNANTFESFGAYRPDAAAVPSGAMTILGTVHKTLFLLALAIGAACFTWSRATLMAEAAPGAAVGSGAWAAALPRRGWREWAWAIPLREP